MKYHGMLIVPIVLTLFTGSTTESVVTPMAAKPKVIGRVVDDYPWRNVDGRDTWGYTTRQCVSFAAWRLSQQGKNVGMWGSADSWDDYGTPGPPKVGAIAQWNAGESSKYYGPTGIGRVAAGSYGHVAYVVKVYSDNSVLVEQYNLDKERAYSTMRVTAPRYLYF